MFEDKKIKTIYTVLVPAWRSDSLIGDFNTLEEAINEDTNLAGYNVVIKKIETIMLEDGWIARKVTIVKR